MSDATNAVAGDSTAAAAAVGANTEGADSAASADAVKEGKLARKQKKGKKAADGTDGKRGQLKAAKDEKKPKKPRATEVMLLKGISKPAARRLFKQIPVASKLRLADDTTNSIRAAIGLTTRRVTRAMVEAVIEAGRQTAYLCDARTAVNLEIPRNSTFQRTSN
jgi:histone H3/H4